MGHVSDLLHGFVGQRGAAHVCMQDDAGRVDDPPQARLKA